MNATATDRELLEEYLRSNSEDAFAALVGRHVDLIYSAALRQVRSPQLAEEVAQSVFTDLWRNVRKLRTDTVLTAWLYRVTRRTAIDVVRRESRRQLREQLALEMTDMNTHSEDWTRIEPLLDEAMETLDEPDRAAILLRYFDNKSLREVGQSLGTSEDAAQKRVSRAVEQLRGFFSKRGVAAGSASLAALLSANAVQSAPIGISSAISTAASLSGAAAHYATTVTATKTILMTTMQKTFITTALAVTIGTAIYATHEVSTSHEQLASLQNQQVPLQQQVQQLVQERDKTADKLAAARQENESLRGDLTELSKLRGEVSRLRSESRELASKKPAVSTDSSDPATEAALKTWAARATQLKQRLAQMPDKAIPELQFISEKDWFDAVKSGKPLESDDDYRQALSDLRQNAKSGFARQFQEALKGYLKSTDGMLPADLSQLKPFFSIPVSDAALQRYSLLQTGKLADLPAGSRLIAETAPPVDEEYDTYFRIGVNGVDSHSVNRTEDAVEEAGMQFAKANQGLLPREVSQLAPYLQPGIDPTKAQSILNKIPAGITTVDQLKAAGMLAK